MNSNNFIINSDELAEFLKANESLSLLLGAFELLNNDLDLEERGYRQHSVIDYSELFRFMHPKYVKDKRENLVIINLMLSKPGLAHSDFYLILPYYYELLSHLQNIASTMKEPFCDELLEKPEVKEFMQIMGMNNPDKAQLEKLNQLGDFLITNFLDLLKKSCHEDYLVKPIDSFLNLINNGNLKLWTEIQNIDEKTLSFSDLTRNWVYKRVRDDLDDISKRMPIQKRKLVSNRIDALAAAFVHEANSIFIKRQEYFVLITGSDIPLAVFRNYPFKSDQLKIPIARDLYYVQSRIYFFKKYETADKILQLLREVLPSLKDFVKKNKPISEHLRGVSSIEEIPVSLRHLVEEIYPAWNVLRKNLLEDMTNIFADLVMDILTDERKKAITETVTIDESLLREIYGTISDVNKRRESARETLNAVTSVIEKMQRKIGKTYDEISSEIPAVKLSQDAETQIDAFAAEYQITLLREAERVAKKKKKNRITEEDIKEALSELIIEGRL